LTSKLTVVAVDDFKLTSTAHDADPNVMIDLAAATQKWLDSQPAVIRMGAEMLANDVVYGHPFPFEEDR